MSRKRGKLSKEEMAVLDTNMDVMSDEQLAVLLNRTPETVEKYKAKKQQSTEIEASTVAGIRSDLEKKYFWHELQDQLTEQELQAFVSRWVALCSQFQAVRPTDEMQMVDLIRTEIMLQRIFKREKDVVLEIDEVKKELADLEDPKISIADRDVDRIVVLRGQLNSLMMAQGTFGKDRNQLQADKSKLFRDLKSTRDQLYKQLEDNKTTFWDLLRMLEDKEVREREGRQMELVRLAAGKAAQDLAEETNYEDGTVDRPLLSPEILLAEGERDETNRSDQEREVPTH